MDRVKIKSSELVIIKKILAWQVAQSLGCEDEDSLKTHALLIAVDYKEDSFFPLMVGDYFKPFINEDVGGSWLEFSSQIIDRYIDNDKDKVYEFLGENMAKEKWDNGVVFSDLDFITSNTGVPKWTHSVQHLFVRDGYLQSIFWFVEVDRYHQSQNAISFLAEHDALTGLYNRHKLSSFKEEIDAENRDDVFYILFDLDKFKQINDTYGHANGDRALLTFAKRLEEIFFHKAFNTVFRLGGDEFLVIATHVTEEVLMPYIQNASQPFDVIIDDGKVIKAYTSFGYGCDIHKADEMLYAVKASKKN